MELSLFDVLGPVMIGPSSSHTAGAARLADVARQIAGEFVHVSFGLHGSFARTYRGHGTDRALVAGALGLSPQDERLRRAFDLARERGVAFDFYPTHVEGAHENTVVMTFRRADGRERTIEGASLGGGRGRGRRLDGGARAAEPGDARRAAQRRGRGARAVAAPPAAAGGPGPAARNSERGARPRRGGGGGACAQRRGGKRWNSRSLTSWDR